jgi:hypothetical protein
MRTDFKWTAREKRYKEGLDDAPLRSLALEKYGSSSEDKAQDQVPFRRKWLDAPHGRQSHREQYVLDKQGGPYCIYLQSVSVQP